MFGDISNPFHTGVFEFCIWVESFSHGLLNDDLLALAQQFNHALAMRYRLVYTARHTVKV